MSAVLEITAAEFNSVVLESDVPVLVDFWAPWCGPCKMLSPVIEYVARDAGDKAKVCKVDISDPGNKELAAAYSISQVPTMLVFVGGKQADMIKGATTKDNILKHIEEASSKREA